MGGTSLLEWVHLLQLFKWFTCHLIEDFLEPRVCIDEMLLGFLKVK